MIHNGMSHGDEQRVMAAKHGFPEALKRLQVRTWGGQSGGHQSGKPSHSPQGSPDNPFSVAVSGRLLDERRDGRSRLPFRHCRDIAEFRSIRSGGEIDPHFRSGALGCRVILCQTLADFPGAHPDDGIFTQIDVRWSAENLYRDGTLFESPPLASQGFCAHVLEELLAALAAVKHGAG